MTVESVQVVNKPAFLEVSNGEVLIAIATNIPTELSRASPVLPKTPNMEYLPLNDTTYFQVDLLKEVRNCISHIIRLRSLFCSIRVSTSLHFLPILLEN